MTIGTDTELAADQLSTIDASTREAYLHQTDEGVFGLEAVVADFDERDLEQLRSVAGAVRTQPADDVQAAIALAGSAAQSKFQLFPGDCDLFERVHIKAPTRAAALARLANLMIETIGRVFPHPDLQFSEMLFGLYPEECTRAERICRAGSPISWSLSDVDARAVTVEDSRGNARSVGIAEAAENPGFVKLDWVLADPEKDRIVAVTKVIDATWESPDGKVVALDGVVDSFYQEIYLDPEAKAHVEELIDKVRPAGLEEYVAQLNKEVVKYSDPNNASFGKVAKRLYNIFRITKRVDEALYLRELFDDPAARLYQIPAALHAMENVFGKQRLDRDVVMTQLENMEGVVREHYERNDADDLVAAIRDLPDASEPKRTENMRTITERVNDAVSDYFEDRLNSHAGIAAYIAEQRSGG